MKLFNQGLRNQMLRETRQMELITLEILTKIYNVAGITNPPDIVAWIATLMRLTLLLERSKLMPETMDQIELKKQFCRKDFNMVNLLNPIMAEVR